MHRIIKLLLLALSAGVVGRASAQNFPFPQHVAYTAGTIKPSVSQSTLDQATKSFYDAWKAQYLVSGCAPDQYYVYYTIDSPDTPDPTNAVTVSEAHGYGMLITVLMAGYDTNAQVYFDGLYRFYTNHFSRITPGLMGWQEVSPDCAFAPGGDDSATDGDMDIAYSLLLAHRQWGSDGAINYLHAATNAIAAVMQGDVNSNAWSVLLGDWSTPDEKKFYFGTRTSDFLMDHFRSYHAFSGDTNWTRVIDECYAIVDRMQTKFSKKSGLLPDFVVGTQKNPKPAPGNFLEDKTDGQYSWNACRTPWRLGTDYLVSGDPRALAALNRINQFIQAATAGDPSNINAGYKLTGKPLPPDHSLAFTAPFAVGAMVNATNQVWLDQLWTNVSSQSVADDSYYGNSIKMIDLIVLSGNWWTP